MIRETITIALLMSSSIAFAQQRAVCLAPCDPDAASYQAGNEVVPTPQAAVESDWFRQSVPSAVYCGPGPGRHQALYGPSGHCNQPSLYDFSPFVVAAQCPAVNAAVDRDGFLPTSKALGITPDDGQPQAAPQPDTPQPTIVQRGNRVTATRPSGAEVPFQFIGGAWLPERGEDRLTQLANGWSYRVADGSEEFYVGGILANSIAADGSPTSYEFNDRGLEVRRVTGELWTTTEWHPKFRLKARTAEPGLITTYAYSDDGRLLTVKIQKTLDPTGQMAFDAQRDGAESLKSVFAYNAGGQVVRMREPQTTIDVTYEAELVNIDLRKVNYDAGVWFLSANRYQLTPKPRGPDVGFCGSKESEPIVPDGVDRLKLDFTQACKAHDECYGRCGSDKGKCDQELQVGMLEQCVAANYPADPGGKGNFRLDACMRWASTYHRFVTWFGSVAYRDAQKNCLPGKCQ